MVRELKPGAIPVRKCQYQLPLEARVGIFPYINTLQQVGIMIECQSAWNTLILPVKKEGGQDYRPVQDLTQVSQTAITLHSTVANPYTLLSLLPPSAKIYTCLYLKYTFFCLLRYLNPFLSLNGKIQQGAPNNSSLGLASHKDLRIPRSFLGKPWLPIWIHSSQEGLDTGCYNTWMICCWLQRIKNTAGKELRLC